jgi:hypothetical protein
MTKGRNNAEVWRSGARGSILARMLVLTRAPGRPAKRRHAAAEALGSAPPSRAAHTA